ncbi:LpqB family beta-propeller domain-containing protein [Corynebacterium aquatimens]|uniref:Lipoprotein LpqB n=1 Tax=Corynebacterium aquatimens TaxID=1190508 RepID=A0A931E2Q4_9CORY|nr:LpqB family beta-propeller domain-containing protein [Corynebacterium aquatimens]MBG6123158.1 hypothetical protein [Corynebacterium aquatimens]WJY66511.1 Lipoprotein LpqB precursor [Corynebacterium aquatimens]
MRNLRSSISMLSLLCVATLTGCTTLPSNTEPHAIRSFEPTKPDAPVIVPEDGQQPDLIVRDFFAACAHPTSDFEVARNFLTPRASEAWNPGDKKLIVEGLDIKTALGDEGSAKPNTFLVTANIVGELWPGGAFVPNTGQFEGELSVEQVNGQWRISNLPNDLVLERTELSKNYQHINLYFFDAPGQSLVTDKRWVYSRHKAVDSELARMLVEGPAEQLLPALSVETPESVAFVGHNQGRYEFTGFGDADEQTRARFAAQLVWTLAIAGIAGPYSIYADGTPLVGGSPELNTRDFTDLDPSGRVPGGRAVYAQSNGNVFRIKEGEVTPLPAPLGEGGRIASIDIASDGAYAAALKDSPDGEQAFYFGSMDGDTVAFHREVFRAKSMTRPTFETDHRVAWTVADGSRIKRAVRSATTDDVTVSDVDLVLPNGVEENISVLRLSRTGARAVFIAGGRLFVGVVKRDEDGGRSIVNVAEYAPDLGGAVSAEWQPDGSLIVGTSNVIAPVVRVEQDGFSSEPLPIGNITAPVVAVGSTDSTIYATDSSSILELPAKNRNQPFWREVPGLQGMRSAPIIARR